MDPQRIALPIPGAVSVQSQLTWRDGVYWLTLSYPSPTPLEAHDILHEPVTVTLGQGVTSLEQRLSAVQTTIVRPVELTVRFGAQPPVSVAVPTDIPARPDYLPPLAIRLVDSDTGEVVGERWRKDESRN